MTNLIKTQFNDHEWLSTMELCGALAILSNKDTRTEFKRLWSRRKHEPVRQWSVAASGLPAVHHLINHRAELWSRITAHAVDGKVGYVTEGMDCDCTQYRYEGIMGLPAGALLHQRERDHHEEYLDGPEGTYYVDPTTFTPRRYRSADRALEAFEDGHPYSVTTGELSYE